MLKVDAEFIKRLQAGEYADMVPTATPAREWHAEKLSTFLNKLKAQTTHEAPVSST